MRFYRLILAFLAACLAILVVTRGDASYSKASRDRDIAFLVDVHFGEGYFLSKYAELEKKNAESIGARFERVGARVINQELFQTMLFEDLGERYEQKARAWVADMYVRHLSTREIKALAEYAKSDVGRELLSLLQPLDQKPPELIAAFFEGAGRPIAERMPTLKTEAEVFLYDQAVLVNDYLSMTRVADIAEMPHVVAFEDEKRRAEAVAIMRTMKPDFDLLLRSD